MEKLEIGYPCTFYIRPDGRTRQAPIRNMAQEDYDWFKENNVALSGEQFGGMFTFYADVGVTLDDGETPDECIITVSESACPFDTFHKLRKQAEKKKAEDG